MKEEPTESPVSIPEFVTEFLAQPASFHQESKLRQWLQEDPSHQRMYDEYLDIWQGSLKAFRTKDYDQQEAWNRLRGSMKPAGPEFGPQVAWIARNRVWKNAMAAAVFVSLLFLAGFLAFRLYLQIQTPPAVSEYHVPYGSKSAVVLPDGSKVWLNAGSKISFDSRFGMRKRELQLEGEAHFTVAKAKTAFRVNAAGLTVEAAGTVFNLKAYPEESVIETTVEEGIVYIFRSAAGKPSPGKTVLRANQRATFVHTKGLNRETGAGGIGVPGAPPVSKSAGTDGIIKISIAKNIKPVVFTSWKDERWIIEREELQHLAKKLERRYNVRIDFRDESLKGYVFSGILKDETLEQVLGYIQHTAPIGFDIYQDQVTLYEVNALKSRIGR